MSQLNIDTHSTSLNILDRNEIKAAKQSGNVLKVTRILLFFSVKNI